MTDSKKLFLDTAVFINALTNRSKAARLLLYSNRPDMYSNEYCARELWRYLAYDVRLPVHEANNHVDSVKRRVKILPTPQANQYKKLALPDKLKSDKPVIQGALGINAVLVTYDRLLLKEAKKFVETKTPEEL